jgi:hypothetical protein
MFRENTSPFWAATTLTTLRNSDPLRSLCVFWRNLLVTLHSNSWSATPIWIALVVFKVAR